MNLPRSLLKEFAEITNGSSQEKETSQYVRGTITSSGETKYVKIDGSSTVTPISEIVDVQDGDRVLVSIENHKATIIGNFTFPPSARKEQEAIDKAEDASDKAEGAQNTADSAVGTAQSASQKADQAILSAEEASVLADQAKESATTAMETANAANANATEAKTSAEEAKQSATTARQESAAAQTAVANAQAEVTKINQEIVTVKGDINTALTDLADQAAEIQATKETMELNYAKKTDVETVEATITTEISKKVGELQTTIEQSYAAKTDIVDLEGKLQTQITQNAGNISSTVSKVEKLESDTSEAQQQVDIALGKAEAAQNAAATAQTQAQAAQTAADEAKANAATAQTSATEAQQKADAAQAKANEADLAVQTAQSDLNEAKQNLANVTNRVGATETEIADAQLKVEAAQTAVNDALADAAEANLAATNAQAAADKAKEDAVMAQQAASTAQMKADNAQTTADRAQADASEALKDVAALTSRVTSAETAIVQNTEQISLTASKTEEIGQKVSEVEADIENNYYSKTQTESLLQIESEKITSKVSQTTTEEISKIKVGGRNLLLNSDNQIINSDYMSAQYDLSEKMKSGEDYSFRLWGTLGAGKTGFKLCLNSEETKLADLTDNGDGTYSATFSGSASIEESDVIQIYALESSVSIDSTVTKVKLEIGNKPTDWTPAPEDMATNESVNNVRDTVTDTAERVTSNESTIEQLANSISTLVTDEDGQSMMTQTSEGWTFNIGALQSQINAATDSITDIEKDVNETSELMDKTQSLINDVVQKTAYITMVTDSNGDPCIELGKQDNPFKLRITNTSIDFMQDTERIAYITNRQLYIQKSAVTDEMKIGSTSGFVWRKRSNGNMGLRWEDE